MEALWEVLASAEEVDVGHWYETAEAVGDAVEHIAAVGLDLGTGIRMVVAWV